MYPSSAIVWNGVGSFWIFKSNGWVKVPFYFFFFLNINFRLSIVLWLHMMRKCKGCIVYRCDIMFYHCGLTEKTKMYVHIHTFIIHTTYLSTIFWITLESRFHKVYCKAQNIHIHTKYCTCSNINTLLCMFLSCCLVMFGFLMKITNRLSLKSTLFIWKWN